MDFIVEPIKNAFNYSGRTRRERFWKWTGFAVILSSLLNILPIFDGGILSFFLIFPIHLVIFFSSLAIGVRRLHDMGKSGWWYLIAFLPLIGILVLLYYWIQDSEVGANLWGASPKYSSEYDEFAEEANLYSDSGYSK